MTKKNDKDGRLLAIALSLVSGLPIIDFEFPDDTRLFLLYDKQHGKVADAAGWHDRDMFPYHVLMKKRLPLVRDGYNAFIRTPQELGFSKYDDDRIRDAYSAHKDIDHIKQVILDSGHERKNIPFSCRVINKRKDREDFLFHDGRIETTFIELHLFMLWADGFPPFVVMAERRSGSGDIRTRIFKAQHEGSAFSHCAETRIGDIVARHFGSDEFSFIYETDDDDPSDNLVGRVLRRENTPVQGPLDGEVAACMALMERQRLSAKAPSQPRNTHSI